MAGLPPTADIARAFETTEKCHDRTSDRRVPQQVAALIAPRIVDNPDVRKITGTESGIGYRVAETA